MTQAELESYLEKTADILLRPDDQADRGQKMSKIQ